MMLPPEARALFALLWPKGSGWSYYWHCKRSTWFKAAAPPDLPAQSDVYFGLNLVEQPRNAAQRATHGTLAHLSALFAEFDAKDFGGDLAHVRWHVEHLRIPPSVAILSGGGVHAYWPLIWPNPITDDNRETLISVQHRWTALVGSDPGAKDLARVLRVPGTLNTKYDPPRRVEVLWIDSDYFLLECLVQHLDTFGPPAPKQPVPVPVVDFPTRGRTQADDRRRAYGLSALDDELRALAATAPGGRNVALNTAALKLGALVAGGALELETVASALYQTALSMGLDRSFTEKAVRATIRSGLAAGLRQPRGVPNAG